MDYLFNNRMFSISNIKFATWMVLCLSTVLSGTLLMCMNYRIHVYNSRDNTNGNTHAVKDSFTVLYKSLFKENQTNDMSNNLDTYASYSNDTDFRKQLFTIAAAVKRRPDDPNKHTHSSYPGINITELLRNIIPAENSSSKLKCHSNLDLAVFVHIAVREIDDIKRMIKIR